MRPEWRCGPAGRHRYRRRWPHRNGDALSSLQGLMVWKQVLFQDLVRVKERPRLVRGKTSGGDDRGNGGQDKAECESIFHVSKNVIDGCPCDIGHQTGPTTSLAAEIIPCSEAQRHPRPSAATAAGRGLRAHQCRHRCIGRRWSGGNEPRAYFPGPATKRGTPLH